MKSVFFFREFFFDEKGLGFFEITWISAWSSRPTKFRGQYRLIHQYLYYNSNLQARVITLREVASPTQFSSNSLYEQEATTKTAHGTDHGPVQLTSPSGKEPSPSSVPTPVSPKTVAGKRPYRRRTECTTRWTIPQFVTQELIPFKNEFMAFKKACKSRNDGTNELINEKSTHANR